MKEKVIIGERIGIKTILAGYVEWSIFGLMGAVGFYNLVGRYFISDSRVNLLVSLIIFIVVVLLVTPLFGANEYLEFSNEKVCHYRAGCYLQKWYRAIMIIMKKPDLCNLEIKTSEIYSVQLSYVRFTMLYGQAGYQLKMTFLLKDGSLFSVLPAGIDDMKKGRFEQAFSLLEENGVTIVDKFNLRSVLNDKNSFYLHIKEIEDLEKC